MGLITQLIGNVGKAKMEEQRAKTAQIQDQVEAWRTIAANKDTPDETKQKAIANILQLTSKHGGKEGKEHAPVLGMVLNKLAGVGMNIAGVPQQQQLPQAKYQLSPSELVMTPEQRDTRDVETYSTRVDKAAKAGLITPGEAARGKKTRVLTGQEPSDAAGGSQPEVSFRKPDGTMEYLWRQPDGTFKNRHGQTIDPPDEWEMIDPRSQRARAPLKVQGTDHDLQEYAEEHPERKFDPNKSYLLTYEGSKVVRVNDAPAPTTADRTVFGQLLAKNRLKYPTAESLGLPTTATAQEYAVLIGQITAQEFEDVRNIRLGDVQQRVWTREFLSGIGAGPGVQVKPPGGTTPTVQPGGAQPVGGGAAAEKPASQFDTPIPPERMKDYQDWVAQLPENLRRTEDYDLRGAFLEGAKPEGGHLTDQFKKPSHMTFSTESQYSGRNGDVGGRWVKSNGSWTFYASPTNLQWHSAEELQEYFRRAEPGNKLVLPPAASKPAVQTQTAPGSEPAPSEKPSKLPPLTDQEKQQVRLYLNSAAKTGGRGGGAVGAGTVGALKGQRILEQRTGLNPVTLPAEAAVYQGRLQALTFSVQQVEALTRVTKTLDKFGDRLITNARKVTDSGSPFLNRPLRSIKAALVGDPVLRQYLVDLNEVQREYGILTAGGSQSRAMLPVTVTEKMEDVIKGNMTLREVIATVQEIQLSSQMAIDAQHEQQTDIQKRIADSPLGRVFGSEFQPAAPSPPSGGRSRGGSDKADKPAERPAGALSKEAEDYINSVKKKK